MFSPDLFSKPLRDRINRLIAVANRPPKEPEEKEEKPEPDPEPKKKPYRVAVHYDSAEFGEDAAKTAVAYIEGCLGQIWRTEAVVGKEVPDKLAKDQNYHDYGRWAQSESGVEAHQHILVASTTGSHGGPSFSRVGNADDLAELEPEYQRIGRGWNHNIVNTLLHELAHGLGAGDSFGPSHGDGTKIDGCITPMNSNPVDCHAHVYSDISATEIKEYMKETVGYEDG